MRLLSRTTRSVAPTEAGEQLLARLRPALTDIQDALDQLSGLRDKPAGRVRLLVPRLAGTTVLGPKLAKFTRDYPDVVLEITADDSRLDIVAGGFDAGIHFGEYIQKDMIAVRVSKDHRAAIVGAPSYFKSHPKPKTPHDLLKHRCINFRHGSAGVYRWEFDKGKKSLSVAVNGPLIVDDVETLVRAAIDGVGLAFVSDERVAPQLAKRGAHSRAGGLVPAVPRILPLLPEPATAAGRAFRVDQYLEVVTRYLRNGVNVAQAPV